VPEPDPEEQSRAVPDHPENGSDEAGAAPSTTVGTGSVLAIGCLVAVVLLVIVAFAVRWAGGGW
jgi:hypothetical protein